MRAALSDAIKDKENLEERYQTLELQTKYCDDSCSDSQQILLKDLNNIIRLNKFEIRRAKTEYKLLERNHIQQLLHNSSRGRLCIQTESVLSRRDLVAAATKELVVLESSTP